MSMDGVSAHMLKRFGFVEPFDVGQSVMPSVHLGPAARRNANGYEIVHRDQPKEEMTRLQSWRRMQWHGRDKIEVEDFIQRTYWRYPRTYVAGEGVEFTIMVRPDGSKVIASPAYAPVDAAESLLMAANLVIEGFGGVEFVCADLVPPLSVPIKRLNWEIFPQGRVPWAQVRKEIDRVTERASASIKPVIRARVQVVEQYGPDFAAIGRAGFDGYWVFGFTKHDLYVLESRMLDNATYVLDADWQAVSQLTKAEVINSDLSVARLIHDASWTEKLDHVLRHVLPSKAA
ncbi:hypothetical protein CO641_12645 [Lysobacteraceae bacterium NML91-0213]|nr:hypothetical protein CO641_12645 [Xanthomonadaceae bacterium NML91-0213]